MKKVVRILLLSMLMLIALSACGKEQPINEQIKTGHGGAELFVEDELSNEIIACTETKDVERLKSLMSDYALNSSDWDKAIGDLYSYFPDEYTPTEICNYASQRDMSRGKFVGVGEYYECRISFDNEGVKYRLYYVWWKHVPDDESKQGIHSVVLMSEDAYNNDEYELHGIKDDPGVYIFTGDDK